MPPALFPLRRLILRLALTLASPFFAAAVLFALLRRGSAWVLVPAAMGALVVALGYVAWLVVRARLGPLADMLEASGTLAESRRPR